MPADWDIKKSRHQGRENQGENVRQKNACLLLNAIVTS